MPSSAVVDGDTWRDDFTTFDDGTWNRIHRSCFARDNVGVEEGMLWLRIVPDPANVDCHGVTGARVTTYGKKEFPKGTFTARIKFVTAPGSWQTFWLTGNSGEPFPANGEIDVAEVAGRLPGQTPHHLHSSRASAPDRKCTQGGTADTAPDGVWREYAVTTSTREVVLRIDGEIVGRYAPNGVCSWPFGDPMRMLFSARGGAYGGTVNVARYPVTYFVDWVQWQAGVDQPEPPSTLGYRGGTQAAAQGSAVSVAVPAGVQSDDVLLLVATGNQSSSTRTLQAPAGWTPLGVQDDQSMQTSVWWRRATGSDDGASIRLTSLNGGLKWNVQLLAYSGVSGAPTATSAAETLWTGHHTTPMTPAPAGAWVVQHWADKSNSTTTWSVPRGHRLRLLNAGDRSSGRVSSLSADVGPAHAGMVGGSTAVADGPNGKATMWTVVLPG
jgi:beta-glucanase (GH16 family)